MTKGADTSRFRRDVGTTKEFLAGCRTKKATTNTAGTPGQGSRAYTMNVQRPDEPGHAYAQLAPVWPAPHAPVPDDGTQGTNQGPVPGAHGGCTPAEPHHRGQCASSRAAFRRCSGCMWGACCQPNEQCTACRVCEPVVFANQMQHASSSTDEPMISRHRSLPCQCDTCAVGRSALHVGEIDEWGDNLVQRDD